MCQPEKKKKKKKSVMAIRFTKHHLASKDLSLVDYKKKKNRLLLPGVVTRVIYPTDPLARSFRAFVPYQVQY